MGITYEELLDWFANEAAIKRLNTVEEVAAVAVLWHRTSAAASPARARSMAARRQRILDRGRHPFPDDRDVVEAELQRMREAFEALRGGRLGPSSAEEEFLAGYDTVRNMVSTVFLARQTSVFPGDRASDQLTQRQ